MNNRLIEWHDKLIPVRWIVNTCCLGLGLIGAGLVALFAFDWPVVWFIMTISGGLIFINSLSVYLFRDKSQDVNRSKP